jgi:hypothetical protein
VLDNIDAAVPERAKEHIEDSGHSAIAKKHKRTKLIKWPLVRRTAHQHKSIQKVTARIHHPDRDTDQRSHSKRVQDGQPDTLIASRLSSTNRTGGPAQEKTQC